jgi:Protein of unknown function (DUF2635)
VAQKDIYIKPMLGKSIPYPQSRTFLRQSGAWVKPSTYWNRRIAQKDVAIATPPVITPVAVSNVAPGTSNVSTK